MVSRKILATVGLLIVLAVVGGGLLTIVTTPIVDSGPFSARQADLAPTPLTEQTRICERFRFTTTSGTAKLFALKNVELPLGKYLYTGTSPGGASIELYEVPNEQIAPPTQGTTLFTYGLNVPSLPTLTVTDDGETQIQATGANWQAFDTNDVTLRTGGYWYWLCVRSPSAASGNAQYGVGWPMDDDGTYSVLISGVNIVDTHAYKWFRGNVNSFQVSTRQRDWFHMSMRLMGSEQTTPVVSSLQVSISRADVNDKTVSFASTVSGGQTPYKYLWKFGDGSTSAEANPIHTYASYGTYSASLTVTDSQSSPSSITKTKSITLAVLTVDFTSRANGRTITFTSTVSGGVSPYNYSWAFGDGKVAYIANPIHPYEADNTYTVRLDVRDTSGTPASVSKPITVSGPPAPIVGGIETVSQNKLFVSLAAVSVSGGSPPYTFSWTFGDGSAAVSGQSATHTYAVNGTYRVVLAISDTRQGSLSLNKDLDVSTGIVGGNMVVSFTTEQKSGTIIEFTPTVTGGTPDYTYSWDLGDGETSTKQGPAHEYEITETKIYSVTLTVTDAAGVEQTFSKDVTVTVEPVPPISIGPLEIILLLAGAGAIVGGAVRKGKFLFIGIPVGFVLIILALLFMFGVF